MLKLIKSPSAHQRSRHIEIHKPQMFGRGNYGIGAAFLINKIDFILTDQIVYGNRDRSYFPDSLESLQDFRTILHLHDDPVPRQNSRCPEGIAHLSGIVVHLHVRYLPPLEDITDMLTCRPALQP